VNHSVVARDQLEVIVVKLMQRLHYHHHHVLMMIITMMIMMITMALHPLVLMVLVVVMVMVMPRPLQSDLADPHRKYVDSTCTTSSSVPANMPLMD
jgi:hypothetical protein